MMREKDDNVNQSSNAPDDDVLELAHQLMHDYRALLHQVLRDGPHGITHMDSRVLGYFAHHTGATQSDLAQHSGRDKAQIARLIKGLRERGLLEGEADQQDRRNVRLSLTAEGRSAHKALQRQGARLRAQAVAGLSAPQRQQLIVLLHQVRANLAALR